MRTDQYFMKIGKLLKYGLILLTAVILLLWIYVQSHQPTLRGNLELSGLKSEVEVYFDDYGIPHIYAGNREDAYMAFGYIHAQDRLFQMEMMRRVGAGELAEVLGPDMKKTDAFFRTLGTNRQAKIDAERFDRLPEGVKAITYAYVSGVNEYIKTAKLPLEFKVLGFEPDTFTIESLYSISGYMAYSFAYSLRTDPLVEDIKNRFGPDYLRDLELGVVTDLYPLDTSTVRADSIEVPTESMAMVRPHLPDMLPYPTLQGSNNWALGPSRTLSSKVMLSNDTHIKYSAPGAWYEAHIEYPGFGFYGNFLSGIPVALVGHSRNHAWGLTMFEDDDSDFFYERFVDDEMKETVYRDSLKASVTKIEETIAVKGAEDTVISVYQTSHGVIINDFMPIEMEEPVSMYWNYTHFDNTLLEAFYRLNRAVDINDFRRGVKLINSPGLNVAYGDAAGNIALWSAGKLIDRSDSTDGKAFARGYSSVDEYRGYLDFESNPQIENPPSGIVYSANQMHDSLEGVLYPGYYAPQTRAKRIKQRLSEEFPTSVENMKGVMLDNVSLTESEVSAEIVKVIRMSGSVLSDLEEDALDVISDWDGSHDLLDTQPTIYYKVLYYTLRGMMMDEMGKELFDKMFETHLIKRSYPLMIQNDNSIWWDDLNTKEKVESREDVVVRAFKKSIGEISEELGPELNLWNWEKVHFVEHPHPFSQNSVMKQFFHIGPYPAPGGNETVNNAGFHYNGDGEYMAHYGPAMRIIIDFADIENALSILPTGNSGNVMSPHYNDQAEMYVKGEFRKMMMNKKEITDLDNLLKLSPN